MGSLLRFNAMNFIFNDKMDFLCYNNNVFKKTKEKEKKNEKNLDKIL